MRREFMLCVPQAFLTAIQGRVNGPAGHNGDGFSAAFTNAFASVAAGPKASWDQEYVKVLDGGKCSTLRRATHANGDPEGGCCSRPG